MRRAGGGGVGGVPGMHTRCSVTPPPLPPPLLSHPASYGERAHWDGRVSPRRSLGASLDTETQRGTSQGVPFE